MQLTGLGVQYCKVGFQVLYMFWQVWVYTGNFEMEIFLTNLNNFYIVCIISVDKTLSNAVFSAMTLLAGYPFPLHQSSKVSFINLKSGLNVGWK